LRVPLRCAPPAWLRTPASGRLRRNRSSPGSKPAAFLFRIRDAHTIALTFDDGPNANTGAVLDVLRPTT